MITTQGTLAVAFRELASAIEAGKYGEGDDVDTDAINDDLEEFMTKA